MMDLDLVLLQLLPKEAHETALCLLCAVRRKCMDSSTLWEISHVYEKVNFLMDPKIASVFIDPANEDKLCTRNLRASEAFIKFVDPKHMFFKRKHFKRDVRVVAMLCEGVQSKVIPHALWQECFRRYISPTTSEFSKHIRQHMESKLSSSSK